MEQKFTAKYHEDDSFELGNHNIYITQAMDSGVDRTFFLTYEAFEEIAQAIQKLKEDGKG